MYVQVKLQETETEKIMTCWVDDPNRFNKFDILELRDLPGKWKIIEKYKTQKRREHIHTDWNVGGLK